MATKLYKNNYVQTIDGKKIKITPLKLKYLYDFMDHFETIGNSKNDEEAIEVLVECVRICMMQYYPEISNSTEDIEDNFDMPTIYEILDYSAGIKMNKNKQDKDVKQQAVESKDKNDWASFDLLSIESEVFLLGMWKNFDEMEESICLPELIHLISTQRDLDYKEKRFMAALQGVDLDKGTGYSGGEQAKGQKEWEDLKARVYSKGKATDSNDILALQGQNAKKAGFGIGMGLDYEDLRSSPNKNV
jgi:hypothetical protein